MFREKISKENEKNDEFKIYYQGTPKAYYDLKSDQKYENKLTLLLIYDFRYPLLFAFTILTLNIIYSTIDF